MARDQRFWLDANSLFVFLIFIRLPRRGGTRVVVTARYLKHDFVGIIVFCKITRVIFFIDTGEIADCCEYVCVGCIRWTSAYQLWPDKSESETQ